MGIRTRDFPTKAQIQRGNRVNFKVFVPSTREKSIKIHSSAFRKRIVGTTTFLNRLFQGATMTQSVGSYLDKKRRVIQENVAVISVSTTTELYNRFDVRVRDYLKMKKQHWGQESMAYEFEGNLVFI